MKDLKEVNGIFNDCYKLYKKYAAMDSGNIVPVLESLMSEADDLSKKHDCKLANDIIVAVINELDRGYTEGNKKNE
jgi:hypothetical protein